MGRGRSWQDGKEKGGYWEGSEEQTGLPPPPPPTRRASSAAAAKVADFCGHINAFMSGGFRTVMVVGLCFQGADCASRQEDHQYGGSGKAKQIPIYLGPDEQSYCAPCWEDLMTEVRALKRNASNRKKAGKMPHKESQNPESGGKGSWADWRPTEDPAEGASTYTDDRGTWRLEGASSSGAEAWGTGQGREESQSSWNRDRSWEETTHDRDQGWGGEEWGQGQKRSRRFVAMAEQQQQQRQQQQQQQKRREDEIAEGWRRGVANAEGRSRRDHENEDEEEGDPRWKRTRRGCRGGKKRGKGNRW
jgi:hypothetical protein